MVTIAGETRRIELAPLQEEWKQELLFTIPRDHPEVQRLEGKFRGSGGLSEGMIVELVNGQQAQVSISVTASGLPRSPS